MPLITCPDCNKEVSDAAPACPHCGRPIAQAITSAAPAQKAHVRRASSFFGGGCALQGLGLVCFVLAFVTAFTIIGPIFFFVLGVWLLWYGSRKASWHECSACGGRVSDNGAKLCQHCGAQFQQV